MYAINAFTQYKIRSETLATLSTQDQGALVRAVLGGDWTRDSLGSLLSGVRPVALPEASQTELDEVVAFDWPDSATRDLARRYAQPQLLVCDVLGEATRGDLRLHLQGVAADEEGQPMTMFSAMPPALVSAVRRQIQQVIGQHGPTLAAYRVLGTGETVRTLELSTVLNQRNRQVTKVKLADVYELRLVQSGSDVTVQVRRRATLRESGPHTAPQPMLASRVNAPMLLHALSPGVTPPYAHLDGKPIPNPSTSAQGWLQRISAPAPTTTTAPQSPSKPKIPRGGGKGSSPGGPPAGQDLPPRQPSSTRVPGPEPVPSDAAALPAQPPKTPPPASPPDPWVELPRHIAADPQVVGAARATLARARPLLLTGAPGVGKTLLATLLAEALCGQGNYTLVTADARWTSSEVLGGLRVVPGNTLRYAFQPGVVTRTAERHRLSMAEHGRPHALIIDEFNRAHQDEAFGRLLTLLDVRYRPQLPLVGPDDGAPEAVYLPDNFLLIGTMNDADTARLHDLSAALQRRFTTVHMTTPAGERAYLAARYPDLSAGLLDKLYAVIGTGMVPAGPVASGQAPVGLRDLMPLGTHFMIEVIESVQGGLSLDDALATLLGFQLTPLTNEELRSLADAAHDHGLHHLQARIERAATTAF